MNIVKENSDFQKIMKNGNWYGSECLTLYILENNVNRNGVGVAVGKKAGKSVVRNRIKRLIREVYRKNKESIKQGFDIIIVWRSSAESNKITFNDIQRSLYKCLKKANLTKNEEVIEEEKC